MFSISRCNGCQFIRSYIPGRKNNTKFSYIEFLQ